MDRSILERAILEPRRVLLAGDNSSYSANYYYCPLKCPSCYYFKEKIDSRWPFLCQNPQKGNTDSPPRLSKENGFKQYDYCKYWKEKEVDVKVNQYKKEEKKEENLVNIKKEQKFIGYCFSCEEEIFDTDLISKKHHEIFHQGCYRSYINTDDGQEWDRNEKENERLAVEERQRKIDEHKIWLKSPEGIAFSKKKKEEEKQKEIERTANEKKTRVENEIKQIALDYLDSHKRRKGFLISLLIIPFASYIFSALLCYIIPITAIDGILFGGEFAKLKITIILSIVLYFTQLPKYRSEKSNDKKILNIYEKQRFDNNVEKTIKGLYGQINKYSNEFKDYIYILDENKEKLEKAKRSYADFDGNEIPLIMYNDTATGSAKDGFVLTNNNLYSHSTFDKKIKIPINEINSIALKGSNLVINKYEITLSVLNRLDKRYLLFILNELFQY